MQGIFPIHPYAALILKHIATVFNSNHRSMFDFIISNDMTDAKRFKWFINNYKLQRFERHQSFDNRYAEEVMSGDMALVVYNGNRFIKWVVCRPDGAVELRPANPNYATITVEKEYASDASWFRIVGKVVSIVRKMKPRRAF